MLLGCGISGADLQAPGILQFASSSWAEDAVQAPLALLTQVRPAPEELPGGSAAASTPSQILLDAHVASGLTWDQLARYFGVSRRAVHLWAAGGRMSAANEEMLSRLVALVDSVRELDPAARRQAILRTGSGLNIIDAARSERASRASDINRSPDIHGAPSES